MSTLKSTVAFLLSMMLVACAAIVGNEMDTFNKKEAAARVSVIAAKNSTYTLLQANKISPQEAHDIHINLNAVVAGIDLASTLSATDLKTAEGRLASSLLLLQGIQLKLTERGK